MFIKLTHDDAVIRLNVNDISSYHKKTASAKTIISFRDGESVIQINESPEQIDELIKQVRNKESLSCIAWHLENIYEAIKNR